MKKMFWKQAQSLIFNEANKNNLYFIEFTTSWCDEECKYMEAIIKDLEKKFANNPNIIFIEIDAEEAKLYRELASKFTILQIPTFLIVKNNSILKKGQGIYPKEIIYDWFDEVMD